MPKPSLLPFWAFWQALMETRRDGPLESTSGDRLEEDVDYYIENGLYVFTERYLLNRGYCCQSGCRHCPYGFVRVIPAKKEEGGRS